MPANMMAIAGMARSYRGFCIAQSFCSRAASTGSGQARPAPTLAFALRILGGNQVKRSGFRPVLDLQSRHPLELALVIGDEYPSPGFGMGSDP
jgi:hypothetical protein